MTPLRILDFGFEIANYQSTVRQFAIRNPKFAMGRQVVG